MAIHEVMGSIHISSTNSSNSLARLEGPFPGVTPELWGDRVS